MFRTLTYAAAFAGGLATSAAIAASQDANAMADNLQSPTFVTNQAVNQWRAPKLVVLAVYDSGHHKVGTIQDLLVDHNGTVQTAVIGVGGFLVDRI